MARATRRPGLAVIALAGLAVAGCVDEVGSGLPAAWRPPIVGGTVERGEPAVVLLYHDWGAGCTASVIAPRVAITARHCVRQDEGRGSYFPASGFHVYVGPSMYEFTDEYWVSEVRSTDGWDIDNNDFALLIFDRDFRHGTKRWEFMPWPGFVAGARITAIGYGQTRFDDPDSAGTKYRRDGVVQAVGPIERYALGDREFISQGENTCQGDSGGPIVYNDVVVGVVSRGEEGCTGLGWMSRVSSYADMVRQALRDTGACVPTSVEVCNGLDDDCSGTVDDGLGESCPCGGGSPTGPEVCDGVDNDCNGQIDDLPACGCTGGASASTEVCDGVDNDCNGQVDEVCQALGEGCAEDRQCSTGLCLDGLCTAHCSAAAPCPTGGYCEGPPCGDGLCRPLAGGSAVGRRCTGNGECATGLCAPTASGGSVCARHCVPDQLGCFADEVCSTIAPGCGGCLLEGQWSPPRWFGEPCDGDGDCLSGICMVDGDPAPCGSGCTYRYCSGPCGPGVACPPGGHCRDGACVRGPESAPGDTCATAGDCPGGSCVALFGTPRCVLACPGDGVCQAGFGCREGVCWPDLLYPGDHCNPGEDGYCMGGLCDFVGSDRLCLEPCGAARECPSGLACLPYPDRLNGVCVPLQYAAGGTVIGGDDLRGACECVAAPAAARPGEWLAAAALAGLLLVARRRLGRG